MDKNFDPKAFSLKVRYQGGIITVDIPKQKDYQMNTTDSKKTYQMAIDKFTMNFLNEDEFSKYLKQKYPHLKEPFEVYMEYTGLDDFPKKHDLVFGYNKELEEFIKVNKIKDKFLASDSFSVETFIDAFKEEVEYKMNEYEYHNEYERFMLNNNLYDNDMAKLIELYRKNKQAFKDFNTISYNNIRANCISHYIDMPLRYLEYDLNQVPNVMHDNQWHKEKQEIEDKLKREKQELKTKKDTFPKDNWAITYSVYSKQEPIKDTYDFSNFTEDPEEQMEQFTHPSYTSEELNQEIEDVATESQEQSVQEKIYHIDYNNNGQAVIPLDGIEEPVEPLYYNEEGQTLLFNPNDYNNKKR